MDRQERDATFARQQGEWAREFELARQKSGLSVEHVAELCGISTRSLSGYISGKQRLNLRLLNSLADAVGASRLGWAQHFELVDPDLLRAGQEREELLARTKMAEERLAQVRGAALICQAALTTGRWKVRVEPLIEGPDACRLRTGDLCVISRTDGAAFRASDVRAEPLFASTLDAAGAVRQPGAVFMPGHEGGADPAQDLRSEWVWMVPTLNLVRAADQRPRRCHAREILIVSTHTGSWATDVATLVGRSLGYATSTTTAMSRYLLGEQIRDDLNTDQTGRPHQIRERIAVETHASQSARPSLLVWAHAVTKPDETIIRQLLTKTDDRLLVYLRLTDRQHDYLTHRIRGNNNRETLESRRQLLDHAIDQTSKSVLALDTGFPDDLDPAEPLSRATRDALLERAILHALHVLHWLHQEHHGPALPDLHDRAPQKFRDIAARLAPTLEERSVGTGLTNGRIYS